METKSADLSSLRIKRYRDEGPSSPIKKYLIPAVIILLILIGGYFLLSALLNPAVEVKLTTAVIQTPAQSNALLTASGYIVAQRKASVASKGTGRLVFIGVVEGDQVKRNQVIARLEDNDIRAQLQEAEANLKLNEADLKDAENDFNRIKKLFESGSVSQQIDALFQNSTAETKTETEKAFQQGFVAATSTIITSMNIISFVIIGIIMLVLGNTMIMSARERTREYAVFKTLGFNGGHLTGLIMGESLFISALGGALGLFLTFPIVAAFESFIPKGWFPVFEIETSTIVYAVSAALFIGIAAAIFPVHRALRTKIIEGFRFVG